MDVFLEFIHRILICKNTPVLVVPFTLTEHIIDKPDSEKLQLGKRNSELNASQEK